MSSSEPTLAPITAPRSRPRALADVHFNSLANPEIVTSSEDESAESRAIAPGDARSLVGVSLGRAQTRLISPQTPAAEKEAAIEEQGGFFEGLQIEDDIYLDDDSDKSKATTPTEEKTPQTGAADGTDERQSRPHTRDGQHIRLPSPWKAGPKKFKRTDESRSMLKDGFRRRASSSSPSGMSSLEGWRDAFMSSMPSLPKHFSFASPFSTAPNSDSERKTRPVNRQRRSGSLFASFSSSNLHTRPPRTSTISGTHTPTQPPHSPSIPRPSTTNTTPTMSTFSKDATSPSSVGPSSSNKDLSRLPSSSGSTLRPEISRVNSHSRSLRRSNSESSLTTFRTLSRAPSLGDDSRFEHVQEQVNSRMKAIRDSWQDTNIRLPLLPSLPSFSDLSLNRANSFSKKSNLQTTRRIENRSGTASPLHPQEFKQNTQSAKAPTQGASTAKTPHTHPHFSKALAELTGDVVVLGGYRGSILRSAEPPHRQLWAPIKVGLNVRKVDLEVGLNEEDDERATEKVIPGGMLTHIGPVDISKRLFKRLRASDNARSGKLRVHDYGYDWRLDPGFLSKNLIEYLESLPCNRPGTPKEKRGATVIAHSLGGLITRNAVNQRPDLFAGVVYAGVPMTCVNILGPFRNGDGVLLSSRVLTAQVNFTIRTSFALLPLNGRCFFNRETKEEYPVDFFDPQSWVDYRFSPCIARPLPSLAEPAPPSALAGIMNSMASVLPGRKSSISARTKQIAQHPAENAVNGIANPSEMDAGNASSEKAEANGNIDINGTDNMNIQMDGSNLAKPMVPEDAGNEPSTSIATTVTIPREAALAYLTRALASVKKFKQGLDFQPEHANANAYPPAAVIYGRNTPTVYGARVASREAIKHASAYDDLAFASGDGVVLAKAAMVPEGYQVARGGLVSSERGHVTLLGDLEAVGRCLRAVMASRRKGTGMGIQT